MKKVLFATTALIATASMAAADVRISGYGRFGLDYNDANDRAVNGISKTTITSRLRLQFDMSTETDSGVTFGARFRAQAESRDNVPGGAVFNGARFFASYQGFTVGLPGYACPRLTDFRLDRRLDLHHPVEKAHTVSGSSQSQGQVDIFLVALDSERSRDLDGAGEGPAFSPNHAQSATPDVNGRGLGPGKILGPGPVLSASRGREKNKQ